MIVYVLFIWLNGSAQPYLAYKDAANCWTDQKMFEAQQLVADCRIATIVTPVGADDAR